jgi:hypothetical protein
MPKWRRINGAAILPARAAARLGATRRQLLEEVDRPALTSLPAEPYEFIVFVCQDDGVDRRARLFIKPMGHANSARFIWIVI